MFAGSRHVYWKSIIFHVGSCHSSRSLQIPFIIGLAQENIYRKRWIYQLTKGFLKKKNVQFWDFSFMLSDTWFPQTSGYPTGELLNCGNDGCSWILCKNKQFLDTIDSLSTS
jgi:hypothetical protein